MAAQKTGGSDGVDPNVPLTAPEAQAVRTTWLYVSAITSVPVGEMVIP